MKKTSIKNAQIWVNNFNIKMDRNMSKSNDCHNIYQI